MSRHLRISTGRVNAKGMFVLFLIESSAPFVDESLGASDEIDKLTYMLFPLENVEHQIISFFLRKNLPYRLIVPVHCVDVRME